MKYLTTILVLALFSFTLSAQTDIQKKLQTQFIMVEDGGTIDIPAGNYTSLGTITMDGKKNVTIKGAGKDKTVISFKKQTEGAEGLRVSNSENITIEGLAVEDAKGDAIKVTATKGIIFRDVRTSWSGKPKSKNGAYGLYPVGSENVLIEGCEAYGASDAGIYVGQSHNIIVRNSVAHHNVAGIEIENSTMADVYNCEAYNNTGGILVFDLPDLPKKRGGNVRVYDNKVWENNYKNFAPKGNIVGGVPPGTGIMILATNNVEIYNNEIINNRTTNTSIVSYLMTQRKYKDPDYYPYPTSIYIHDNKYVRERQRPTFKNKIGLLLFTKFKKDVPDIIFDGILDEKTIDENGHFKEEYRICIRNNGDARFANLDAANDFKNLSTDISLYDCTRSSLKAPKLSSLR